MLPMPVADVLDDWFECDALKGALGAAGVMDLRHGPRSGGTAFRLLHHHVGNAPGVFRPPVSNLRQVLQAKPGIALRRDAVAGIAVREARVAAVVLASGQEIATARVICGADPRRALLEWLDPGWLDPEFTRAVSHIRARGVAARLSLALDRPAPFQSLCIAPSLDYLERAYDDVKYGRISRHPYLEARTRNAADGAVVDVQIQYAPYALSEGAWDEARRQSVGEIALKALSHAVPDLAAAVKQWSVITPRDFEMHYGFPEGQPHHAELALDQALWLRPVPGWVSYRTPVGGLYLCGPATHPGGAIAGAAGANAARMVLQDLRRKVRS
jgi:phytoene dehydrogenase-like protein